MKKEMLKIVIILVLLIIVFPAHLQGFSIPETSISTEIYQDIVNGDGKVNITDIAIVSQRYGITTASLKYDRT